MKASASLALRSLLFLFLFLGLFSDAAHVSQPLQPSGPVVSGKKGAGDEPSAWHMAMAPLFTAHDTTTVVGPSRIRYVFVHDKPSWIRRQHRNRIITEWLVIGSMAMMFLALALFLFRRQKPLFPATSVETPTAYPSINV